MCLNTLHDKVRSLGLGTLYERHWGPGGGGFRDLFDNTSPEWPATEIGQKVMDLQAFERAGVPVAELIGHYRETYTQQGDGGRVLDNLPMTMRAYREAGFWPSLPPDVAAAVDGSGRTL